MKQLNKMGLREVLERMATDELESMLQTELDREDSDPEAVRLILRILEARHREEPEVHTADDQGDLAWQRYQSRVRRFRQSQEGGHRWWISVAASLVLVLFLAMAVIPQQAQAETFWQMIQKWSDSVLGYFSGEGRKVDLYYSFETENPGLQQVYDAVVELGVTEPVVPMWLPDGYELTSLETINTPMSTGLGARFLCNESSIVFKIDVFEGEPAHQYYKDDTHYESFEKDGITYNITRNNDRWGAVWTRENIECSIILDCEEEALRRVLDSI